MDRSSVRRSRADERWDGRSLYLVLRVEPPPGVSLPVQRKADEVDQLAVDEVVEQRDSR